MSRAIKFRVWDKDSKKYLYISETVDGEFWVNNGVSREEMPTNRDSLEQYTGLKDEDGKEIYEGDIVTLNCYWEEVDPRDCFAITFEDGCFRVGDGFENEAGKYLKEYRIAGNIHENPELLGGEDA